MNEDEESLTSLLRDIRACTYCSAILPLGPRPIVQASLAARILIVGQAPGTRVHETGIPWHDPSGDRLREWLALDETDFYDAEKIALMPMGFCYPGVSTSGGDNPPRPECAPLWHAPLLRQLPDIRLTVLVGQYAQKAYLGRRMTLTDAVRDFQSFLPKIVPLPHPSWRSTGWMKRNPWFEAELLPKLRQAVAGALEGRN